MNKVERNKMDYIIASKQNDTISKSDGLSDRITNNPIASEISKKGDVVIREAVNLAVEKLKLSYKGIEGSFSIEPRLLKSDINDKLKNICSDNLEIGTNIFINKKLNKNGSSKKTCERHIRPDGGLIFFTSQKTNSRYLLGVCENKTQGTNNKRIKKGLNKQALGNAIERAYKNVREIENYLHSENIHPYIVFCNGEDLENEDSSIRERLTAMTDHSPFNKLYTLNISDNNGYPIRRTSVYIGVKGTEKMSHIIYEMINESIQYYNLKYGYNVIL